MGGGGTLAHRTERPLFSVRCAFPGWFFFLINDLIKTSTSGIGRSPDPRHLNVPEHVKKYLKVSPDLPIFREENSDLTSTACVAECHE